MCWSSRGLALLAAALIGAACAGNGGQRYVRIAVLPFENLTADPALDWAGRALSEYLALSLTGTPRISAFGAPALRDAVAGRATHVLHGYFSRGRAYAALEDLVTHRMAPAASAAGSDVVSLGAALARAVEPAARAVTGREDALRAYADGEFERAVALDPDFGAAYVAWARADAAKALKAAEPRRLAAVERAKLQVLAARDRPSRRRALVALAEAASADPAAFRALAELDTAARSFQTAARWYDEAIARDPAPELYNAAGYVLAYAGDLPGATGRLQRYRELRPAEANPLDSLGEVHYYFGRLEEAERYFLDAHTKSPAFLGGGALYKAAWARVMMGDRKGAEGHAQRFFQARTGTDDPRTARLHAQWDFLAGRRAEALARIERDTSPAAAAHRAVWALATGDRAAAAKYGPLRPVFDACVAVLDDRPADALPTFRKLYEMTPPGSPEPTGVLLAWALIAAGKAAEAQPLVERNPIPDAVTDHPLVALAWPRILELRKAIRPR